MALAFALRFKLRFVIGAGSIGQGIVRRVSADKHVLQAGLRRGWPMRFELPRRYARRLRGNEAASCDKLR